MKRSDAQAIAERVLYGNEQSRAFAKRLGRDNEVPVVVEGSVRFDASGWVFPYQSRAYLESGDYRDSLVGNVALVVGHDGSVAPLAWRKGLHERPESRSSLGRGTTDERVGDEASSAALKDALLAALDEADRLELWWRGELIEAEDTPEAFIFTTRAHDPAERFRIVVAKDTLAAQLEVLRVDPLAGK